MTNLARLIILSIIGAFAVISFFIALRIVIHVIVLAFLGLIAYVVIRDLLAQRKQE